MRFIKNKKSIVFLALLGIFIAGEAALAKELVAGWPPSPLGTGLSATSELPHFIQYLYEWGISLGGLAVFIALLIAGFQYLSSAGNPAMMKEARDRIVSALLGLALLLSSWLILNTINPQFTTLRLPAFDPGTPPDMEETLKDVESDAEKMGKVISETELCTSATITKNDGTEFTFTPESGCVVFGADYIETDARYTIQGYIGNKPKPCLGYLWLFTADKCDTGIVPYDLMSTHKEMSITATNAQSGRLDVPKMEISFWDIVKNFLGL